MDSSVGHSGVHVRRHLDSDSRRRGHGLRQFQQRPPSGSQTRTAGHRRRVHRRQTLSEDELAARASRTTSGRRRGVRPEDSRDERDANRPKLLRRGACRSVHQWLGLRRSPASSRGLSRCRRRRHSDAQQREGSEADRTIRQGLEESRAAGHRADELLPNTDEDLRAMGHLSRDLGQSQSSSEYQGDARRDTTDLPGANAAQRRAGDRQRQRSLSFAERPRARRSREEILAGQVEELVAPGVLCLSCYYSLS